MKNCHFLIFRPSLLRLYWIPVCACVFLICGETIFLEKELFLTVWAYNFSHFHFVKILLKYDEICLKMKSLRIVIHESIAKLGSEEQN